jgi:hypothetical protein
MRRAFCKIWISAVGIAVVTMDAGCGHTAAPGVSNPSGPSVDPNVAFEQYDEAAKLFECSKAYGDMYDALQDSITAS